MFPLVLTSCITLIKFLIFVVLGLTCFVRCVSCLKLRSPNMNRTLMRRTPGACIIIIDGLDGDDARDLIDPVPGRGGEGACTITIIINIIIITIIMKTIFFQYQRLDRPVPGGGSEGERGVQQGAAGHRHHRPLCCWQVLHIIHHDHHVIP